MAAHSVTVPTWLGLILTASMMLGSLLMSYHTADKTTAVAIATLKTQQTDTTQRLDRIENEVTGVDGKVDSLIQGLLKANGDKR